MTVTDIDFLPIEYRRQCERRRAQPWQIVTATVVVGLIAAVAAVQRCEWRRVQSELDGIAPQSKTATLLRDQLADVERRLWLAQANAELYTYLRHPWPRTRLLASLVAPLPSNVVLRQIEISRQRPTAPATPSEERRMHDAGWRTAPSAHRDLARLRDRVDPTTTMVAFKGIAENVAAIYRYLDRLENAEMFGDVELDYYDRSADGKAGKGLEFRAVATVRPGYGQPGGPTRPGSVVARK